MRDAFTATSAPARCILVDDICTTGATMASCIEALRAEGVEHVAALAVAHTQLRNTTPT